MRTWTNMLPPFMHKETPFKLRDTFRTMKIWTSAVKKYCLFELHHPWNSNVGWSPSRVLCLGSPSILTRSPRCMGDFGSVWMSLISIGEPLDQYVFQGSKLWESQKWSSQQEMPLGTLGKNITPCILVYVLCHTFWGHSPYCNNWDRSGASLCGFSPELSLTQLYLYDSNLSLVTFEVNVAPCWVCWWEFAHLFKHLREVWW